MARKTQPPLPPRNEIIVQRPMEDIMHDSMIPYSEYVILERALPRVEDGLKPVQRRILYTMHELGLTPDKPHRKCARIVGDCLGKFHPHGDTSVYDALARLAQPFALRGMLVDGHGNFGSIDGDSPAAMRYTEARMTPLAMEMLRDLEKNTVNFSLNFDDTQKEPDMLPGRYPNLLVNGASGIAVGLATNIPPHNLREAIAAVIAQMDNPAITTEELMVHMPAPDFPTGGILLCDDELKNAYETGRGKLQLRAKIDIEDGPSGRKLIVITEVPYQVPKAAMLEKILRLSEEKKGILTGIHDIRDESDRTGLRAVIELKRDVDPQKVLNYLYKYSDLQVTFGVNMVAIAGGKPVQMGIKEIIRHYIDHQKSVVTRRTQFDLEQAQARAHILEGLIIAVDNLDEVIRLIRASKNPKEARAALMAAFDLTEIQAQAILDMRLQRLTNLEIVALRHEYAEIQKLIAKLTAILKSEKKLLGVIKTELAEISEKYGDDRRTQLTYDMPREIVIEKEAPVADEAVVLLTPNGFLKRMLPKTYEKAVSDNAEIEPPFRLLKGMTDYKLLFFTDAGNCYAITASQVPECRMKDRGMPLAGLLAGLEKNESVIEALCLPPTEWSGDLMFITTNGMIKRSALAEYSVRKTRFTAINLKNGDKLLSLFVMPADMESLLMVTSSGMAIHFPVGDVAAIGRVSAGVKGIALSDGDQVIAAMPGGFEGELLLISDMGYAKRCLMVDFELQGRAGKGTKCFSLLKNGSNGKQIVFADIVREPYQLTVHQKDDTQTPLDSDSIRIEMRSGKGTPYVVVVLGNDIVSVTRNKPQ
ncbi:MAG: DNA topoisomerase 4 subunit A [Clostridia bacterium]|nr:DNA topoisomerase 4 subunit A [Clostridia bacterium]